MRKSHDHKRDDVREGVQGASAMPRWNPEKTRSALRHFMAKKGLTVAAWTRAAGVADSTLRNFLDGVSNGLKLDSLVKLAEAAGATVSQVIGEENSIVAAPMGLDAQLLGGVLAEIEAYLAGMSQALPAPDKAAVAVMLYGLMAQHPDEPRKIAGGPYENVVRFVLERRRT